MKYYFFCSFVGIGIINPNLGFGNTYVSSNGPDLDISEAQYTIEKNLRMKCCTILYYHEVSEEIFDKALAREVSLMEQQQKAKNVN